MRDTICSRQDKVLAGGDLTVDEATDLLDEDAALAAAGKAHEIGAEALGLVAASHFDVCSPRDSMTGYSGSGVPCSVKKSSRDEGHSTRTEDGASALSTC